MIFTEYYTYEGAVRILMIIGVSVFAYLGMLVLLWVTRDKNYKSPEAKSGRCGK